jgi:hypothetical protein
MHDELPVVIGATPAEKTQVDIAVAQRRPMDRVCDHRCRTAVLRDRATASLVRRRRQRRETTTGGPAED